VQARIMGIADIFEALTASDRPYKPSMKLSQAMNILNTLKRGGHIDPDLFDVFVNSGVYRRYGEQYLSPGQLDEVHLTP
jgi:HD-GYP domain-containing protein (c-di-GMP phosphodiesterase class II)